MRRLVLLIVVVGLMSASVSGQSINIDYQDLAGAPGPGYAAAGLPGAWNALTAEPGTPQSLVNLRGRPVAATVMHDLGHALGFDDPGTTGDDQDLMDDGLGDMGDVQMTVWFDGLVDGTDQIIARNNQTNPLTMLRSITAAATDASMKQMAPWESAAFDWLAAYEQMNSKKASTADERTAAVDSLLATDWQ